MAWHAPSNTDQAIAWLRARVPLTADEWQELTDAAKQEAFTVAGVAQLDLVADVLASLADAVEKGQSLAGWKKAIADRLEAAWDGTVDNPAWRLETIFRTNVQRAYSAGRYHEQQKSKADRPFLMFSAVLDKRTTPHCKAADGTVLPIDSPWWHEHTPPCHFNCRSVTISLTASQAARYGVTAKPSALEADDGFGAPPGADDDEWPRREDYPPELWTQYEHARRRET